MRIAVTGPNGQLGSELVRQGCLPVQADITSVRSLSGEIARLRPDVVINCAASTGVDVCEFAVLEAVKINVSGVQNLVAAFRGRIVQMSTDYIFDGTLGPYSEEHIPHPINMYGWTKLGAEVYLAAHCPGHVIVRTTILFSDSPKCFVNRILARLKKGESFEVSNDLRGSPTYVPWLATDILALVKMDFSGVINLAGYHLLSRWQFARHIARAWDFDPDLVQPGEREVKDALARRPVYAGLKVDKSLELGLPARDAIQALAELRQKMEAQSERITTER